MREASNNLSPAIFYNLKIQGIYFEKSTFSNNLHELSEFWPLSAPLFKVNLLISLIFDGWNIPLGVATLRRNVVD